MTIESDNTSTSATEAPAIKGPRKAKKAKPAKKVVRGKKHGARAAETAKSLD